MAKKLSLFIEDNSVRILLCENEQVLNWANLPLEAGIMNNGVVTDEEKLANLLKQQLDFLKIKQKGVILGLSGLNSLYRIINIPQIPDKLLAEAVKREAERVMPVVPGDVYLSFQPLPSRTDERRIFLTVFPKATTDSLIKMVRRAGLDPYLMDLAPLALSRTVSVERAIAVSSRGNNLDIVVMVEKIPQVLRSLPLPGESESLTEKLVSIAEEIERTVSFYNQGQPDNQLDEKVPILVSGDLAHMQDSWELLSSRLGHPISALPSPVQDAVGFDAAQFMINVGLALKDTQGQKGAVESSLINFNALPEIYHRKVFSIMNVVLPVGVIGGAGLVIIMGFTAAGTGAQVDALSAQAASIQSQLRAGQADLTAMKAQIAQLQSQVQPLQDTANALSNKSTALKNSRSNSDDNFSQVVNLLPSTVYLTELQYTDTGSSFTVNGNTEKLQDIYTYAHSLRDTNLYYVRIDTITWDDSNSVYTFTFYLTVR